MPYQNLPKDKWEPMDRCVEQVMGRGHSKDSAIAICYTSIMGDKKKINKEFTEEQAKEIGDKLKIDWKKYPLEEFVMGMNEELEHRDITHGDPIETAKIVIAHLKEDKHYYSKLKNLAEKGDENMRPININFYGDYWKSVADQPDNRNADWVSGTEKEDKEISACVKEKVKSGVNPEDAVKACTKGKDKKEEIEDMPLAETSEFRKDLIDKSIGKDPIEKNSIGKEVNKEPMKKEETKVVDEKLGKQAGQEGEGRQVAPNDAEAKKVEEEKEMAVCMKEMTGKGKTEAEARKACKGQMKEHEAGESKEEKDKEEEKVEKKADEKPAEVEQVQDVNALVKSLIEKIDKLVEKQEEKPVSAPAEGATPKEEAPKEEAPKEEAPKEEAPKEGASPEGTEVQKAVGDLTQKVDNTLLKITEKFDSLSKSFDEKMKDLADRVNKLEEQPVPSKVASTIVVSKSDGLGDLSATEQEELDRVTKELDGLKAMQRDDLEKYQAGRYWEKAFDLMAKRDGLLAKKATGQSAVQY